MLDRLLGSTYSAFDKNPNAQIALRIKHPDRATWRVADRVLTLGTEAGAELVTIELRDRTMIELAGLIEEAGCQIVYLNLDMAQRAADSLLAGSARQSDANGDALRAYDSLLWSVLDAFAVVLEDAQEDVVTALRQLYLGTATDELLDVWGDYFGLVRNEGEPDEVYRLRIIAETLRPRVSKLAIEDAIKATTGHTVELYEPWRNTFVLSQSKVDGDDHIPDGTYWTHNVIQPVTSEEVDWTEILNVVERSRAAGVIVAPPRFDARLSVDATIEPVVLSAQTHTMSLQAFSDVNGRLDGFALGDSEPSAVNWKVAMAQLITVHNNDPLANPSSFDATRRNIRRANVVLSDSDPLGAINAVLPRSYWIQPPDFMTLSVHGLSDYEGRIYLGMVNEIITLMAGSVSFEDFSGARATFGIEEIRAFGPIDMGLPTQIGSLAIEEVHYSALSIPAPEVSLWGFSGAGPWAQDTTTGWGEETPSGEGIKPQS
jgi:hypothetical protein